MKEADRNKDIYNTMSQIMLEAYIGCYGSRERRCLSQMGRGVRKPSFICLIYLSIVHLFIYLPIHPVTHAMIIY